jgi:hypothetical protein
VSKIFVATSVTVSEEEVVVVKEVVVLALELTADLPVK